MSIAETMKYESARDPEFTEWITSTIGGERLRHCIQCGQCSATCPLSSYMDYTPRRLMQMAREGFKDDVLRSRTIWLCASCYGCSVECPKEIKITDIMYRLKDRALKEKVAPRGFPMPVVIKSFAGMAHDKGRVSEVRVMINVYARTGIYKALGMTSLGLGMLRTRRFSLKSEAIKHRKDLTTLLDTVRGDKEASKP